MFYLVGIIIILPSSSSSHHHHPDVVTIIILSLAHHLNVLSRWHHHQPDVVIIIILSLAHHLNVLSRWHHYHNHYPDLLLYSSLLLHTAHSDNIFRNMHLPATFLKSYPAQVPIS